LTKLFQSLERYPRAFLAFIGLGLAGVIDWWTGFEIHPSTFFAALF
jgi:hypothetical protein